MSKIMNFLTASTLAALLCYGSVLGNTTQDNLRLIKYRTCTDMLDASNMFSCFLNNTLTPTSGCAQHWLPCGDGYLTSTGVVNYQGDPCNMVEWTWECVNVSNYTYIPAECSHSVDRVVYRIVVNPSITNITLICLITFIWLFALHTVCASGSQNVVNYDSDSTNSGDSSDYGDSDDDEDVSDSDAETHHSCDEDDEAGSDKGLPVETSSTASLDALSEILNDN